MADRVTVNISNGVADVKLNRPDKLNALDQDMFKAIIEAARQIESNRSVRVVVLSGEGPSFCAGLDFMSFMAMGKDKGEGAFDGFQVEVDRIANWFQRTGYDWQQLSVPVIAAISGHCYGGGLQIALGADIRYAAPDAQLSVMEIKWGLIPDMSGTQTLRDLVRLDVAKELTFTGRIVTSDEAMDLGLVTKTSDDPYALAHETARLIASKSPHAIQAGKMLLNETWRATAKEGLLLEAETQKSLIGSPNQMEAVMANMQKRTPDFSDASR